jgi:SH3 domain protein
MNTMLSFLHRPARPLAFLLFLACLTAAPVKAETVYIKPSLEVLMRKGKGEGYRITTTVPMGTPVELVQAEKEWSRIRLQDGTEGWVRSRFLGSSPLIPIANLKGGIGSGEATMESLADDNSRLRKELASCTTDRSTMADKYQTLAGDPDSALHAKTSLDEAQRQIKELQQKLATAQIECTVLRKNESIKWFFTGGLVLLIGWLTGRLGGNNRKKRPSLL